MAQSTPNILAVALDLDAPLGSISLDDRPRGDAPGLQVPEKAFREDTERPTRTGMHRGLRVADETSRRAIVMGGCAGTAAQRR
ncbi:hypothetical protein ASG63_23565 [Methylobacterium sp. Leaf94]|nr:hypothetical protein ASG63_23565 [Methylobacterium sp. Leaf94]